MADKTYRRKARRSRPEDTEQARLEQERRTLLTPRHARGKMPKGWRATFLDALGKTGNVSAACEIAGISRTFAYDQRRKFAAFARLWDARIADAVERAERELFRRGVVGFEGRPVTYKGQIVQQITEYDTTALIAWLKAHAPEKYRERYEVRHTDDAEVDREIRRLARELGQRARGAPIPGE